MAVKEERLDYVQQEHDSFLKEYQELLQKIQVMGQQAQEGSGEYERMLEEGR